MRWELVRCFAKAQSLMRLTVCWRILTSGAWERVLLKADKEHAIQAPVDAVRGKRGERTMVEKSPKYSRQWNGAAESAVRGIQSLTRTYVCALQEKLAYKVDSKSIVLPWLVGHAAYVLSRFVKRDDGRSALARLRGKECDSPLAQVGETVARSKSCAVSWRTTLGHGNVPGSHR